MRSVVYSEIKPRGPGAYLLVALLGVFLALGLLAAWRMEHAGHYITGMTNQIVWGMPHVVAVFLIVAASGALNVASIGSLFGRTAYKPLARLSGLLATALLIGGLAVLVLDLGRPDRLIVAMTTYNFSSIFAWNIFLYVGFLAVVAAYLWTMMDPPVARFAAAFAVVAFVWRLVLTTGTGLIFGFLVAREAYDAAVMAPLFIAMSFAFGLAAFILVLMMACRFGARPLGAALVGRLGRLLAIFVAAVLYFVTVQHLMGLYAAQHRDLERFLLVEGGVHTLLFWIAQVGLGGILPMVLLFNRNAVAKPGMVALAAGLVIVGGLAQVYVIIIGGQAYPLVLFPGMEVRSTFFDGVVHHYAPSIYEITLGLGGVAIAGLVVAVGTAALRFLPETLADEAVDPHFRAAKS